MKILSISGSSRKESSNSKLLDALPFLLEGYSFKRYTSIDQLPLFAAELDKHPWPLAVIKWRKAVADTDAIIIATPEYIYNLPALIKNALEWLTSSGELMKKPVLPITFTPNEPRGEKAMQSLLWSLQALDARILGQLPLYQQEIKFDTEGKLIKNEAALMLIEAIQLFSN